MRNLAAHRGVPVRQITQEDFGGLATRYAPLTKQKYRPKALVSENVDYSARRPTKALGDIAVLENAVGALQVEDFESDTGWTGGTRETASGNFVEVEVAAKGLSSRKLSQVGVGTATMEKTYSPALNLGIPDGSGFDAGFDAGFGSDQNTFRRDTDVFHLWRRPLALPSTVTGYQVRLRFETSTGNHYEVVVAGTGTGEERLELPSGGSGVALYRRARRQDFTKTGAPDWASVAKVQVALQVTTGTGTMTVTFDNLSWSSGRVQDLFQFRRFDSTGLRRSDEYAVAKGNLYRNDSLRWAQVSQLFDTDSDVHSIGFTDRRFVSDGVESPQKVMPDGTVYRMGVANPAKQVTLAQISGGQLATQKVFVLVKFFSNVTGVESGVDDKDARVGTSIDVTGPTAGVRVSNVPVSTDPQVTHVRIFFRPENLSSRTFFRGSSGVDGEVTNGTTTFDFLLAVTQLEGLDVMDEDTDFPSYLDAGGVLREGHPLFFSELQGYVLTVLKERPWELRFSRFRQPEYWAPDDLIPMSEGDNDPISALGSGRHAAFAFKRDALVPLVSVGEPDGVVASASISHRGSVSHRSVVRVGDDVWWANENGVYWIDARSVVRHASYEAQPSWDSLWDPSLLRRVAAVELRSRYQYLISGASLGSPKADRTWVTHYPNRERGVYHEAPGYEISLHTHGFDVAVGVEDSQDIYAVWFARDGVVFLLDRGTSRDGRGFKMRHRTGLWSPAPGGRVVCRWPWLDVTARVAGDNDLTVEAFYAGAILSDVSVLADLQGESAPLGSFTLGTSKLGAGAYVYKRLRLKPRRSRFVQFELSHDGRAEVEVLALNAHWQPTTARGNF